MPASEQQQDNFTEKYPLLSLERGSSQAGRTNRHPGGQLGSNFVLRLVPSPELQHANFTEKYLLLRQKRGLSKPVTSAPELDAIRQSKWCEPSSNHDCKTREDRVCPTLTFPATNLGDAAS